MASNDKKSTSSVSNDQSNFPYQDTASTNVAEQALLKALQDFVVPLIRVVDRNDINQIPLGPEAEKLITALQEFISNIVRRSQSEAPRTVEVSLVEEVYPVAHVFGDDDTTDNKEGNLPPETSEVGNPIMDIHPEVRATLEKQSTFHEKLLSTLREHVFNKMPIRLLCFQSKGTNLQISLLERGVIHTRLASALHAKLHEEDHIPITKRSSSTMETEKEAIKRLISRYARYTILSHTWLRTAPGEVTYSDWNTALFDAKAPGYQKLINFCKTAWMNHGLAFGWMDTVCINKDSSAELDESIRSMYDWYHCASVCIIYLSTTTAVSNMHLDSWFTRGWTLQELLAPDVIKFYSSNWTELDKHSDNNGMNKNITKQIKRATTITRSELRDIFRSPISRRMQLAANRVVTREEDMAYSLMGIFHISSSTAYGEGADCAFFRLLQEILNSYVRSVLDIFNWAGEPSDSRMKRSLLLPSGPQHYLCRSPNKKLLLGQPISPLTLSHLGLRITVILMPAISISDTSTQHDAVGNFYATVDISPVGYYHNIPTSYHVLDKRISGPDGESEDNGWYQITLAVLNLDANEINICIPKTCLAICLKCYQSAGKVTTLGTIVTIKTSEPIVFDLNKLITLEKNDLDKDITSNEATHNEDDDFLNDWDKDTYYQIKRSELVNHGMQLVSLDL